MVTDFLHEAHSSIFPFNAILSSCDAIFLKKVVTVCPRVKIFPV